MYKINYFETLNMQIPIYFLDKKSNTTLVFLHGIKSSIDFIQNLDKLINNYNILAINLPGSHYYKTLNLENIDLNIWIKITNNILNKLKSKNIIIFAHSMSGGVAMGINKFKNIKKIVMFNTIHPFLEKNININLSSKFLSSKNMFENLFIKEKYKNKMISQWNKEKAQKIKYWIPMLNKTIFNSKYLDILEKQYINKKNLIVPIVSENDNVINSKNLLAYYKKINLNANIIGVGHSLSSIYNNDLANLINKLVKAKKRWFWQKNIFKLKNKGKNGI
ncbi:alpha/beta hydrolase [Mycoplasma sp. 744]|uniref:alpha/beta fold hydrolase n=1 Tax=Mycoplasma sp. 744 TaxID=3108531 RepID=UPI002B1E168A|nr:alpha/beta hydrolase [Mycoplasma sp. 744]MEA4115340.1 alpha/beta hydrolase [Mycoplasma sp. 744]